VSGEIGAQRYSGDASIKYVRIKVSSVRPNYRAGFPIDADLCEIRGITQGREDAPETKNGTEIDHAFDTVLESKVQAIVANRSCFNNVL